jgi:hypothetical protein
MFDMSSTNVVAKPIPKPFMAEPVVPSVGHMPNSRTNTGFSLINPLLKFFHWFIALFFY